MTKIDLLHSKHTDRGIQEIGGLMLLRHIGRGGGHIGGRCLDSIRAAQQAVEHPIAGLHGHGGARFVRRRATVKLSTLRIALPNRCHNEAAL